MNNSQMVTDVLNLLGGFEAKKQSLGETIRPPKHLIDPWRPGFHGKIATKNGSLTLDDIKVALDLKMNVHLVGPSGCGKTTAVYGLYDQLNEATRASNRAIFQHNSEVLARDPRGSLEAYKPLPYDIEQYSCHSATRTEEIIGDKTLVFDESGNRIVIETKGAILKAYEEGKTAVIEEIDYAPARTLGQLNMILDGTSEEIMTYINGPRRVYKHEGFRFVATSNTHGMGENAFEYAGTQPLNAAFLSRMNYTVEVTWLSEADEAHILRNKTGLYGKNAEFMIQVAYKTRMAYERGEIEKPISTRTLEYWGKLVASKLKAMRNYSSISEADLWKSVVIPSAIPAYTATFSNEDNKAAVLDMLRVY